MPDVTLVLTRTPIREFIEVTGEMQEADDVADLERRQLYLPRKAKPTDQPSVSHRSGRWGTLGVFRGPKVVAAKFVTPDTVSSPTAATPSATPMQPNLGLALATVAVGIGIDVLRAAHPWLGNDVPTLSPRAPDHLSSPTADPGLVRQVAFADQTLEVTLESAGEVEAVAEYDTMERFRTDLGARSGFVMLHADSKPYGLRMEAGNPVVQTLRTGYSGNCLRVLGGNPGPEQGILIHEAPTIGYLIGCISPRLKGHRNSLANEPGNHSALAMDGIYAAMGGFQNGRTAALFVLK